MAVKRGVKVAGNEVRIIIGENEERVVKNNMSRGGGCV